MPLIDGVWNVTSAEDLREFEASLTQTEVPVTEEMERRIEAALAQPRPAKDTGPSLAALAASNSRTYAGIKRGMDHGLVSIILPVHGSIHIAEQCIRAVYARTAGNFELIVVDDASDDRTAERLAELDRELFFAKLLTNSRNMGFAATVNRGIAAGHIESKYVCLLNSDVLVTDGWLPKMVLALKSDPRNAIVCPATNNTAVVDVPMSPGASYLSQNRAMELYAERRYPEIMPTGFCFMFRRDLLDEIGWLDEAYRNFGEETDLWYRAVRAGYRAVMADDAYVFHERGSSFSALGVDAHTSMRRAASALFNQRWPEWTQWRDRYDVKREIGPTRKAIPALLHRDPAAPYRVAWVVMDARACGAMRFIADLVNELNERGADAKVVVLKREPGQPEEWLGELRCAPVFFDSPVELVHRFGESVFTEGLVLAGTVETASAVRALMDASGGRIRGCLHAQSFDPALVQDEQQRRHVEALYKLLPEVIACSHWVARAIEALGVTPFAVVHPGVDQALFYPRDRSAGDPRPTVMVPMSRAGWWRGWERGLELIQELEKQAAARRVELRILVTGTDKLPIVSRAICLGTVAYTRMAQLLGTEVDVLVDPSHVHSYGMPCLEALASRIRAYQWISNRGCLEYARSGHSDTGEELSAADAARIVLDQMKDTFSLDDISGHNRREQVSHFIAELEDGFKLLARKRRICIVAPHMRKWGGPTTMLRIGEELAARGHAVECVTVYPDIAPDIAAGAKIPLRPSPKSLPDADVYITNSDNPSTKEIAATGRGIMLKLSHNPRFKQLEEQGLQQQWAAVVTTTKWLAEVSVEPQAGWNHPAVVPTVIGWWHYEHARFRCDPTERTYGDGTHERPIRIGTLIHAHPSKGSLDALERIREALPYGIPNQSGYDVIGVGEMPERAIPRSWRDVLPFTYHESPSRDELAKLMQQCDIWVCASASEGLGRMRLEAMSAGALVVAKSGPVLPGMIQAEDNLKAGIQLAIEATKPASCLRGFHYAESFADPGPVMDALERVIEEVCK